MTSRSVDLPNSLEDWASNFHFNLWATEQWPYRELEEGTGVLWYEGRQKLLTWETRVIQLDRFKYSSLDEVGNRLLERFGSFNATQPYMKGKANRGVCIADRSEPIRFHGLSAPAGFRMPQLGWKRVDESLVSDWGGLI